MHVTLRMLALVTGSIVASCAQLYGQASPHHPVAERPFEKPGGPFAVGTIDSLLVDSSRDEILSRDPSDKRRVLVQVWYPAGATGETAPYIRRREEFGGFAGFDSVLHVRTNSFDGAALVKNRERFPVLIYSHGGSWSRFTGTFTTEWLASYGYIVVAIDHNGFNKSVLFPDGYRLVHDTLTFPVPGNKDRRADALASWDYLDRQMFPLWIGDAQFVLGQLEAWNRGGRFRDRLDLSRIGMLGFSFGGAAAVEMAVRDPRIRAVIDQDGQLFGQARSTGTSRPVMFLHNAGSAAPDTSELGGMVKGWTRDFTARSTGPVYDITIARTHHGHFSDLSLLLYQSVFRDTMWINPHRAHQIINAYTLAFFDRFLRDKPSELLSSTTSPFSEVTFRRKDPQSR